MAKTIVIGGVKVRYVWRWRLGEDFEACPVCGAKLPEPDERLIAKAVGEATWQGMKTLAKYVKLRNRLVEDVKTKKISLRQLFDRYRALIGLYRNLRFVTAACGATSIRCDRCGTYLALHVDLGVDVSRAARLEWEDILRLDEGSESIRWWFKRELGLLWPEIRRRIIEEGDARLLTKVTGLLKRYGYFDALV